ncbi:hypothetical protein [Prosthecobacter sp.]|uniref:hypothetical protein n=1 Tax=Prosthecobacter sp. TaxID=1965333 RepID=UPI00378403A0
MKPHLCLCFLFATASLLTGQEAPKDPFVKDKKAAAAAPAPATADGPAVAAELQNVPCFVETFTLPQADYAALLDAPGGHDKLYTNLVAGVKAGKVRLDGCHLVVTHPNTRSTLDSTDELIYPTEWTEADRTGFQYPTAFEMHQLGDHFEFEPTLEEGSGALNVTQVFARDRLQGLRLFKADSTLAGIPVTDMLLRQGSSTCRVIPGIPTFLSTLKDEKAGDVTLVFATLQLITLPEPKAAAHSGRGNLVLTARVISLDRMKGWELLKAHAMEGGACLAALKPLLASKEATLEHIATINTQSNVRAVHESGVLYTYGTEYAPPTANALVQRSNDVKKAAAEARPEGLAGTTATESRGTGFRLEVEPTRSEDGVVAQVTLAPEFVKMTGNLKDKNWNEHYPDVPLFSCQKITTGYAQVIGTTALVGTMNPPGDTGANEHKDEGRMWLLFMDVISE